MDSRKLQRATDVSHLRREKRIKSSDDAATDGDLGALILRSDVARYSFERKCYRKILRIGWTQKVTNEELYRKIQLTETLLQKVIQRKLRLFGHICRMNDSRKIKTLVFGMMDGSNKRGRPHREWSDDIEQWCGTTLQELSHAALDRQRWAAIVRMASDTNGH